MEIDAHDDMDDLRQGFSKRVLGDRIRFGKLQLMSLPHTLEMKRYLNRKKDQSDIALLERYLR